MAEDLAPFFLGAYGENNDFFEKTVTELLRDHVYWRRNFHPEDTPPISTREQYEPAFLDGLAKTQHELHQLTAQLKRSVPFFHPRYLGHMVSDSLMPGLIAQLITTLYNPNNIVDESAPVTVQLEVEVGRQLCRMVGFPLDTQRQPCSLGHLTAVQRKSHRRTRGQRQEHANVVVTPPRQRQDSPPHRTGSTKPSL